MRHSYLDPNFQNFIEQFEYHLKSIVESEKVIKESINDAKREFNQYTITLISIIVGIITIFGTASTVFKVSSYVQMFLTFVTVVISVIAVIMVVTLINLKFPKNKK